MAVPPQTLPLWFNPLGPVGSATNLLRFAVETSATFSCQTAGSRCSFIESFFEEVQGSSGMVANDQQGSSIWTVVDPEKDTLYLGGCNRLGGGACHAVCSTDCQCLLANDRMAPCVQTTLPPLSVLDSFPKPKYPSGKSQNRFLTDSDETNSTTTTTTTTTLNMNNTELNCETNIFQKQLVCGMTSRISATNAQEEYADLNFTLTCDGNKDNDIRTASNCDCQVTVRDSMSGSIRNGCSCSVCPIGYGDNPFLVECPGDAVVAECSSIDCNGSCNGSCQTNCTLSGPDCPLWCGSSYNATTVSGNTTDTNVTETLAPTLAPNMTMPPTNKSDTATPTTTPNSTFANETMMPTLAPTPNMTALGTTGTMGPIFATNSTTSPSNETFSSAPTMSPNATTVPKGNETSKPTVSPNDNETIAPTPSWKVNVTMAPTVLLNATLPDINATWAPTLSPSRTIPDSNITMVPTQSPSMSSDTNETMMPTQSPFVLPGVNETMIPTTSPTAIPDTKETETPTLAPNFSNETLGLNVTYAPTLSPSLALNEVNETNSPFSFPTLAPNKPTVGSNETYSPTLSPTPASNDTAVGLNESVAPTDSPDYALNATPPLIDESDTEPPTESPGQNGSSTETPTVSPVSAFRPPTLDSSPDVQTHLFTGITFYLTGTGLTPLNSAARGVFESATEEFYRRRIKLSPTGSSSLQRQLQNAAAFDTNVSVTGDQQNSTGNAVTYDQVLYFTTALGRIDESTAWNVILGPFTTDEGKQEYLALLRNSSDDFQGVTSVDSPSLTDSDTFNTSTVDDSGGISTVVVIMIVIFGSLCCCCFCCAGIGLMHFRNEGKDSSKNDRVDDDLDLMVGADNDYAGYDVYDTTGVGQIREEQARDNFIDEAGDAPNPTLENWVTSSEQDGPIDEFSTVGPSGTAGNEYRMSNVFRRSEIFGADKDGRRRDDLEFGDSDGSSSSGYSDDGDETSDLKSSSDFDTGSGSGTESGSEGSGSGDYSGSEDSGSEDSGSEDSGSEGEYSGGDSADDWGLA